MKKQLLLMAVFFLFGSTGSSAWGSPQVNILDFGLYKNILSDQTVATNRVSAGVIKPSRGLTLIKQSKTVSIQKGSAFGIRFTVESISGNDDIILTLETIHPPMRNPETGRIHTRETVRTTVCNGQLVGNTFVIEEDWEMVPGKWSFLIWHDGVKIAEQVLTVHGS